MPSIFDFISKPINKVKLLDRPLKSTGLKPFEKLLSAPDNSKAGIVKNTIINLAPESLKVAKDIAQGTARSVASAGITAGNAFSKAANYLISPHINPQPFDTEIPTKGNKTTEAVFGGEPVRDIKGYGEQGLRTAEQLYQATQPDVILSADKDGVVKGKAPVKPLPGALAYPLAALGIGLDLSGLGGGSGALVKNLAKESSEVAIKYALKNSAKSISKDVADELVPYLVKTSDEKTVKNILDYGLKKSRGELKSTATLEGHLVPDKIKGEVQSPTSFISSPISSKIIDTEIIPEKEGVMSFIKKDIPTVVKKNKVVGSIRRGDEVFDVKKGGTLTQKPKPLGISEELKPLAEEANNYKSVGEFVASKAKPSLMNLDNMSIGEKPKNVVSEAKNQFGLKEVLSKPNDYSEVINLFDESGKNIGGIKKEISATTDKPIIAEIYLDPSYRSKGIAEYLYKKFPEAESTSGATGSALTARVRSEGYKDLTDFYNQATKGEATPTTSSLKKVAEEIPNVESPALERSQVVQDKVKPEEDSAIEPNIDKESPVSKSDEEISEPGITKEDLDIQDNRLRRHKAIPFLKYANKKTGKLPKILEGYEGIYGRDMKNLLEKKGLTFDKAQELVNNYFDESEKYVGMQQDYLNLDEQSRRIVAREINEQGFQTISSVLDDLHDSVGAGKFGAKDIETLVNEDVDIPVTKKVNIVDYLRTPDRVLKKVGLEDEANLLRKKYEEYIEELPKNLQKITDWQKRVPSEAANRRIFLSLDGNLRDGDGFSIPLKGEELAVKNEINKWLSEWAERLDLPADERITNYITHIFDKELLKKEFDPDLAKIIDEKIPGSVYDPFLERRLGAKGYKVDTWAALDAYTKRATRKVNMDVALERLKIAADELPLEVVKYVKNYIDKVNMRPSSIDTLIDNTIKGIPGVGYKFGQRPVAVISRTLRQMVYRGTLGLNIGSATRNLSQAANTYSDLGEKYTAMGFYDLFAKGTKELEDVGVLSDNIVQDRSMNATKKFWEKTDKVLFAMFDLAEKVNRGTAYYGAKRRALSQGLSEEKAISAAKKVVRDTQFQFGAIDTPVALQGDAVKLFTILQSFTIKQGERLIEQAIAKDIAGLLRYTVAMLVFMFTMGKLTGQDDDSWWDVLIPKLRLEVPVSVKPLFEFYSALTNQPDKFGNERTLGEKTTDVLKSIIPLIPGGAQAKKTIEGIEASKDEGSYDKSGKKQYSLESPTSKAQAIIFGKSTTPEAKEYFKSKKGDLSSEEKSMIDSRKKYEEVQSLVDKGDSTKAKSIVDSMPDDQYEDYKIIKLFKEVQKLKTAGKSKMGQSLVDSLTPEEYKKYEDVKKVYSLKKEDLRTTLEVVSLYAKAFNTDPANALRALLTKEKLGDVEGNLVEMQRFFGEDYFNKDGSLNQKGSGIFKRKLMEGLGVSEEDIDKYKLEHIVPLAAGGDNSVDNLQLVDTKSHNEYTPIDIAVGKAVREGRITRQIASDLMRKYKKEKTISKEDVLETVKKENKL